MSKVANVLNTFSAILFAIVLLTIYAYLPISIDLNIESLGNIHKQHFFYYSIAIFIGFNILIRLIISVGFKSPNTLLYTWVRLLIFTVNVYLTLLIGFIGVWNNSTHIAPSSFGYLNAMGPTMVVGWIVGLIFIVVNKK